MTRPDLRLDAGGAVSTAILHLAGQQIQNECDLLVARSYGNHQKKVPVGQFRVTSAGKMPRCKAIYHAVCPPYTETNSEEVRLIIEFELLLQPKPCIIATLPILIVWTLLHILCLHVLLPSGSVFGLSPCYCL